MRSYRPLAVFTLTTLLLTSASPLWGQEPSPRWDESVAFDPDAPANTRTQIAPGVFIGARAEMQYEGRQIELRMTRPKNLSRFDPRVSLAISVRPHPKVQIFAETEISAEFDAEASTGGYRGSQGELRQAFVRLDLGGGGRLVVGRQRQRDSREWLWDRRLDGIALSYRGGPFKIEASVTRRDFLPLDFLEDKEDDLTNNYYLGASWDVSRALDLTAYFFARDDLTDRRDSPIQTGIHADGKLGKDLEYSLDLAAALGRDRAKTVRGFGLDASATWEFTRRGRQSLTGAFAFGTGDRDREDSVDSSFRQTGLQGNDGRFNGVTRFNYYGELFDPELSNMSIFTAGYGFRPSKRSSVDLVYHYYLQHVASRKIRDAGIDVDATGLSPRLGSEVDVIVGFREWKNMDIKFLAAAFFPDDALRPMVGTSFLVGLDFRVTF